MSVVDAEGFSFCFLLLAALGGVVTLSASSLLSAAESGESGSLFLEALVRAGDSMASEARDLSEWLPTLICGPS